MPLSRHSEIVAVVLVITTTAITASTAMAQDDHVSNEVDASFEFAKISWSYAEDALNQLSKCHETKSLSEAEGYIFHAQFLVDLARFYADKAQSEADDAESEASGIDCFGAEEQSNNAGGHFAKAEDKFENAFAELSTALKEKHHHYNHDLEKAEASISHAMTHLETGVDELDNTLTELDDCN